MPRESRTSETRPEGGADPLVALARLLARQAAREAFAEASAAPADAPSADHQAKREEHEDGPEA